MPQRSISVESKVGQVVDQAAEGLILQLLLATYRIKENTTDRCVKFETANSIYPRHSTCHRIIRNLTEKVSGYGFEPPLFRSYDHCFHGYYIPARLKRFPESLLLPLLAVKFSCTASITRSFRSKP